MQRGEVDPYEDGSGNRIATVLFYVSHPILEQFPSIAEGGSQRVQGPWHWQSYRHRPLLCIL